MVQKPAGYGGSLSTRLNEYILDVEFPVHKDELVEEARQKEAPPKLVHALTKLPNREFESFDEVIHHFERVENMGRMGVEGDGHDLHEGDDVEIGEEGRQSQLGRSSEGPSPARD